MMSTPFLWDSPKKQGGQSNFEPRFRRVDPPNLNTKPNKERQFNNWKLVTPFHTTVSLSENKFAHMDPVDSTPIARSGIKSERGWNCPHCNKYFKKEGLCSKKHLVKEHRDFSTLPDPKMRNYITSKVIKAELKKTPPKSTYTPNSTIYSHNSMPLDISPVKDEKSEAMAFPKLPGIYESPMSAIPPYMKPEVSDYSDDSSHTSYSVKISNTCVMTDNSRYLGNSLSNGDLESSQEMHDKDDVIYDEGTWVVKVEPKAPEEEDDDGDEFEESFVMDDSYSAYNLVDKVDDTVQASDKDTSWQCPQCFKMFKKVGLCAEKHLSKDHGWPNDQITALMEECKMVTWEKYKCSTCGKMCRNASNLRKHEKIHSPFKPFGCEFCGASFRVEKYLIQHLHSTHSGSKTESELTSCPLCEEAFIVPIDLHKHLAVHENEKNRFCSICGKEFVHESYLANHQKIHDSGRKERDCQECGRKFTKHSHLMNHMLTHTKVKNHACRVCGKVFARRDHLKLHMFKHTGHRPFACKLCDQRFRESSSLRRHIRIHLGIKPYECPVCLNRFQRMEKLKRHVEKLHPNHGLDLSDHAQFKSTNPDEEERLNQIMISAANAAKNDAFPVLLVENQDMAGGIASEQEEGSESEAGEILEYSIETNDSYDSASEHDMEWNESDLEESEMDSHAVHGKSHGQPLPLPNYEKTMLSSTSFADEYNTSDGIKAIAAMETSNNHSPVTIETNGQSPSSSQNSFQSGSSFEDNHQSLFRHKTKGKKRADISSIAQKLLTKRMDNKVNVNTKQHTESELKVPKMEILNGISEDDTHSKRNDGLSQNSERIASPCESEKNNNDASNSQAENDTKPAIKSESESGLTVKSES